MYEKMFMMKAAIGSLTFVLILDTKNSDLIAGMENSDWIAAMKHSDWIAALHGVCAKTAIGSLLLTAIGSLCCCVFRVVYMFIVFCMQPFDSQEQCVYCSHAQASH